MRKVPIQLPDKDYEKIAKAKGILKDKKEAIITHLDNLRQEWDELDIL